MTGRPSASSRTGPRSWRPGGGLSIQSIAGFGEDGFGEMYIVDRGTTTTGEVYRILPDVAAAGGPTLRSDAGGIRFMDLAPNPLTTRTLFALEISHGGHLEVEIHDAAGRLVRRIVSETAPPACSDWPGTDATRGSRRFGRGVLRAGRPGWASGDAAGHGGSVGAVTQSGAFGNAPVMGRPRDLGLSLKRTFCRIAPPDYRITPSFPRRRRSRPICPA